MLFDSANTSTASNGIGFVESDSATIFGLFAKIKFNYTKTPNNFFICFPY